MTRRLCVMATAGVRAGRLHSRRRVVQLRQAHTAANRACVWADLPENKVFFFLFTGEKTARGRDVDPPGRASAHQLPAIAPGNPAADTSRQRVSIIVRAGCLDKSDGW